MSPSRLFRRAESAYRRLFSIDEIATEPILQWALGGLLLFFFATFNRWIDSSNMTVELAERGNAVCWEYFPNCTDYYFLHEIGVGYSQSAFYMLLYAIMLGIVYAMWRRSWTLAHFLFFLLFAWETLGVLVLTFSNGAPYHYYHIALSAALLFVPHKEFFLKLTFVFLYFMSATTKLDPAWILGTYFTSLRDGLPLLPDALTTFFTNAVIFMQIVGAWFLLSKRKLLQRAAFAYFLAFHLYSGVFVTYFYPTVSLPSLIVLFGPLYRPTPIPFGWKTIGGWSIIVLLAIYQILGFAAPGDRRMTLEGNKYGMFMFEANHQCIVTIGTYSSSVPDPLPQGFEVPDGTRCDSFFCRVKTTFEVADTRLLRTERFESGTAWNRCYPYEWWSRYHHRCDRDPNVTRISLTVDHSINGGPFYRTVDLEDVCSTPYRPFNNEWIKEPPEAPLIGYPVTNTYN